MIARSIATALLLNFVCQMSPAIARGGAGTADPPWNSEYIDQLPAEVRSAISHLYGPSLRAAHYFATNCRTSARKRGICIRSTFWGMSDIDSSGATMGPATTRIPECFSEGCPPERRWHESSISRCIARANSCACRNFLSIAYLRE
jgi:hypothetical protein